MSNPPKYAIKPSLWTTHAPGLVEFSALLNRMSEPCVILDRTNCCVLTANTPFIHLTAFAYDELTARPVGELFVNLDPGQLLPGVDIKTNLVRRQRDFLPISLHIHALDPGSQWLLGSIAVSHEGQNRKYQTLNESFTALLQLAKLPGQADPIQAILEALTTLKSILETDFLCVYQAASQEPALSKIASIEPFEIFPKTIPSSDLIRLPRTSVWMPGKRVNTEIHRAGRMNQLSSVISIALGQDDAFMGILVGAKKQGQFDTFHMNLLELIAANVSSALQHHILTESIQQRILYQENFFTIWRTLFDHTQQGVIIVFPDFKIADINQTAELMLGYVDWEVRNQPVENILIGPESLPAALENARRGISNPDIGTVALHRRDGQSFPAQVQVFPAISGQNIFGILIFFSDISEHEQIRMQSQQLEHRALLGQVMAIFAHEVRNPINNISTGLQLLASRIGDKDPNYDVISRMQGDCTRLNDLMDSVLSFSRPLEPKIRPMEIDVLIKRILDRWRPRFTRVNVNTIFHAAVKLPKVAGDPLMIEQVLTNLISNAVEAMSLNGGNLSIRVISRKEDENNPQVEITISDDGPGVPDEIKDRIFEPFVTNKPRGTGLGLAITKRIVAAHRGSIRLNTIPGGTAFQVYLPAYTGDN